MSQYSLSVLCHFVAIADCIIIIINIATKTTNCTVSISYMSTCMCKMLYDYRKAHKDGKARIRSELFSCYNHQ